MSKSKKEDLRVRRTKKLLLDSLIELIEETGYEAVTVKQITERAMVNRATFYLHYEDKSDLLERGIEARMDELESRVDQPNPDPESAVHDEMPRALVAIFEHVAEHRKFYLAVLGPRGVPSLMNRLTSHVEQIIRERIDFLSSQTEEPSRVPIDVAVQYAVASYTGTVMWWLSQGMPYSPMEISRYYVALNVLGLYGCL